MSKYLILCSLSLLCLALPVQAQAPAEPSPTPVPTPSAAVNRPDNLPVSLAVNLHQAVLMALENNQGIKLERFQVPLAEQRLLEQEAIFDARLVAEGQIGAENAKRLLGASTDFVDIFSTNQDVAVGFEKSFETGTDLSLSLGTTASNRSLANGVSNQQVTRLGLSFTQALLQGRDPAVNLALIRQAELGTQLAGYNLRGFAEALVAETETAFWDYLLARQQLLLNELALNLTRQELEQTRQRIQVGRLAEIEAITFETELALRQQERLRSEGLLRQRELELLRLLNPAGEWSNYRLKLDESVGVPNVELNSLAEHLELAVKQRPELQQARILVEQRKLEVVRTRDGLLPVLDVFLLLGKTGYSDSLLGSVANFPGSGFDFSTGFRFSYPLGARAAEARSQIAELSEQEQVQALANLRQLVELDLRRGYLNLTIARQQIDAAKASRSLQQTRFDAELERYRVGRTTGFQAVLAQRELLNAQVTEAQSLITYLKQLTSFYRFEGTLLQRHGVQSLGTLNQP